MSTVEEERQFAPGTIFKLQFSQMKTNSQNGKGRNSKVRKHQSARQHNMLTG